MDRNTKATLRPRRSIKMLEKRSRICAREERDTDVFIGPDVDRSSRATRVSAAGFGRASAGLAFALALLFATATPQAASISPIGAAAFNGDRTFSCDFRGGLNGQLDNDDGNCSEPDYDPIVELEPEPIVVETVAPVVVAISASAPEAEAGSDPDLY